MRIECFSEDSIKEVAALEKAIEGDNAASLATLSSRRELYPQGFRVAMENGKVIGYIESCLWERGEREFAMSFSDVDFVACHHSKGKEIYVIFLATDPVHRRKGVGAQLVKSIQQLAVDEGKTKVTLVAKDELKGFYGRLGFTIVAKAPNWLPGLPNTHMQWLVTSSRGPGET